MELRKKGVLWKRKTGDRNGNDDIRRGHGAGKGGKVHS